MRLFALPIARKDANLWIVTMPDIRKAGDYSGEVFESDNLISNVRFTIKSGAAVENDLF